MKKLTIIDSYDYVVDFIEDIVSNMNNSLSKFGKYTVTNGIISKVIIEDICHQIQSEHSEVGTVKNITEHLLAPKKHNKVTRKLAIEIDDELVQLTNKTISIILGGGYKKIPSRTMFFRESLRVFYDFFIDQVMNEMENEPIMSRIYDLFAEKILGMDAHFKEKRGDYWEDVEKYNISTFFYLSLDLETEFWQSLSDNYENIKKIIESEALNSYNTKEITERIFKFADKFLEEDYRDPDNIIFSKNYTRNNMSLSLEIQKSRLQNLIEVIEPEYATINDKIKIFFLLSFIEKEFGDIVVRLYFHFGPVSQYIKKNSMELSELYVMARSLALVNNGFSYSLEKQKQKTKIKKLLVDISNYNIRHMILLGSYFKKLGSMVNSQFLYSPVILFLNNIFIVILTTWDFPVITYEDEIGKEISKHLPEFKYKDTN